MKDDRILKDEFGRFPEEYPELRENFSPPIDEEFRSEAEYPKSLESAAPGPEFTPPGASKPNTEEDAGRRRMIRKLILYFVAAALGIFMYLGPLGNLAKYIAPLSPEEASARLEELVNPGDPGDPEINIMYAVRDGSEVKFYYIIGFNEFGENGYDVSQKAITLSPYKEAKADPEIDHWEGYSRDPFEHVIDVSSLRNDEQYLLLECEFTRDGVKKKVSAAKKIIDQPPEAETGANFTPDYAQSGIDYRAWFTPQEGDGTEYDFEIWNFEFLCYDEAGEYCGGGLIHSTSADPESVDPESFLPRIVAPEGESASGWSFVYHGPANLEGLRYNPDAKTYAVGLTLHDKTTGLIHTIVSNREELPEESHQEPKVKLFLTSYYSEFRCALEFEDTADVTKVTLEFWNPDTDTLEQTMDLTKEALMFGYYNVDPFTTDFVYENHQEYYDERGTFPFDLIATVRLEYNWDFGTTREYEYSVSSVDATGWEAGWTPESAPASEGWVFPGEFQVTASYNDAPCEILYNQPEKVQDGVMSVVIRIDGEEISYAPGEVFTNQSDFDYETYENDEWVQKHGYSNLLMMPLPGKYKDGEAHVVVFRVTQYIPAYGEIATFEQNEMFFPSKS